MTPEEFLDEHNCKHKNVTDTGYVLDFDGQEWDGFCLDCERMVYGHISKKWKVGWNIRPYDTEELHKIFK